MKRAITISLLSLVFVCAGFVVYAQVPAETAEIIKEFENYQNSVLSALILLDDEAHHIEVDGKAVVDKHLLIKIMTPAGVQTFGTMTFPFDGKMSPLEVTLARTIAPDGSVVDVKPEVIVDESPFSAMPIYSDLKVKKVTFSSVKPGSVLEVCLRYDIDYKLLGSYSGIFMLFNSWQTAHIKWSVDVPAGTELLHKAVRMAKVEPQVTSERGRDVYTWIDFQRFADGWGALMCPPYTSFGPHVLFSTAQDWEELRARYKEIMAGQDQADDAIRAKVKELTADAVGNRQEIIKRLYYFVTQKIRYVAIEFGQAAYRPYPAAEVLANAYGDCKGKSALFIAMLKAAGIDADFAVVRTANNGALDMDIPAHRFNHAIVALKEGDDYRFFDATADMLAFGVIPFSIQGAEALVINDDAKGFVTIAASTAADNVESTQERLVINADGSLRKNYSNEVTGQGDWIMRMSRKYATGKGLKENTQEFLTTVMPGASLKDVSESDYNDFSLPYGTKGSIYAEKFAEKSAGLLMFKVPVSVDPLLFIAASTETRRNAVYLLYPKTVRQNIDIAFPQGYSVKSVPQAISVNNPVSALSVAFKVDSTKLTISSELQLKTAEISSGKYPQFRNTIRKLRDIASQTIVLEKKPE